MSSVEHEFVRDIVDHPEDNVPRLIYADWLEERGSTRGEFIRVQCELTGMDPVDPGRGALESRELQLIRQNSKGWARPIRPYVRHWSYRRGMPERIDVEPEVFLRHGAAIRKLAPIRHVQFHQAAHRLPDLGACRALSGIPSIGFRHCRIGRFGAATTRFRYDFENQGWDPQRMRQQQAEHNRAVAGERRSAAETLVALFNSKHLEGLEALDLAYNSLGDDCIATIVQVNNLANLKQLDLSTNNLTAQSIRALQGRFPQLTTLRLSDFENTRNDDDDEMVGAVPHLLAPLLENLEELRMGRGGVTLAAFRVFNTVESPDLRVLAINGSVLVEQGLLSVRYSAFSKSKLLDNLNELDISSCYIKAGHLKSLATNPNLLSLATLNLDNNELQVKGAQRLATSTNLANLLHLSLNGRASDFQDFDIQDRGAAALLESEHFPRLGSLSMRNQGLTGATVKALQASPYLQQLYHVDLSQNKLGADGAAALVSLGPWPKLAMLNVRGNGLTSADRDSLAESFGYRVVY